MSTVSDREAKRTRVDDNGEEPQAIRDSELYFDDGNIVLSVSYEPNNCVVYFRVHKSLLANEASVFKDIFSTPTSHDMETYDAVPLICLHDDLDQLRGFLNAIYKPRCVFLPQYHPDSARVLVGPLLLARKYQADDLESRIIAHIEADWPANDVDEWDRRNDDLKFKGRKLSNPASALPRASELIALARITGTHKELAKPLAMAYYTLSHTSFSLSDGLQASELFRLWTGRKSMHRYLMREVGSRYKEGATCWTCRLPHSQHYATGILASPDDNPLEVLKRESSKTVADYTDLGCKKCAESLIKFWRELRPRIFSLLPTFFPQ